MLRKLCISVSLSLVPISYEIVIMNHHLVPLMQALFLMDTFEGLFSWLDDKFCIMEQGSHAIIAPNSVHVCNHVITDQGRDTSSGFRPVHLVCDRTHSVFRVADLEP